MLQKSSESFPSPQYVLHSPSTAHVSLHSKSLCKKEARASGVADNLHPLREVAQTENIQFFEFEPQI